MCGIFGMFLSRPLTQADLDLGRKGTAMLAHRGPDAEGQWHDEAAGVFLGHRRLSIIDLTPGSDQPMVRGSHALAYNGEIYNYKSLRKRLKGLGCDLTTSGDTEALLMGWKQWGEEVLDHLDGMFAFALWDGEQGILCRDFFGEKPLYWVQTGDGVYFSSEPAPLAELLNLAPDLSGDRLTAFFTLGYVPDPDTAWQGMHLLPPASVLTVRQGKAGEPRAFWSIPFGEPGHGPVEHPTKAHADKVRDALAQAVESRLVADVPVCLFLSSGVDSPLLAAIASRDLGVAPACLTVSFPRGDSAVNEAPLARAIAHHLGLPFTEVESSEDPRTAGADRALELFGQPNDNITAISCNQISAAAVRQFKVALSGMGGDELFYGYGKHEYVYRHRRDYALPGWRKRLISLSKRVLSTKHRYSTFEALVDVDRSEYYPAIKNDPCIRWLRRLPGFAAWTRGEFSGQGRPEYAIPRYEVARVMPNSHLPAFDHGSMAASLELRSPMLSRGLVEAIASLDPRMLMAFGQKRLLRMLLDRYVPAEFIDKRKLGFVYPPDQMVRNFGDQTPRIPGLDPGLVNEAWENRFRKKIWSRIATRLILADRFLG